jgi:putative transposase
LRIDGEDIVNFYSILSFAQLITFMAKDLYINKYRRQTRRNNTHDYASDCWYFITINTLHRNPYFGQLVTTGHGPSLQPSEIGLIAMEYWNQIPQHFSYTKLDAFVLMPDHLHGILKIESTNNKSSTNKFGGQHLNLGSCINGFKSSVKRYANKNNIDFIWQPRYHDTIIYTLESLNLFRNYIFENPNRARDRSK